MYFSNNSAIKNIFYTYQKLIQQFGMCKMNILQFFLIKNAYLINNLDVEKFQADAKELLDAGFNIVIFPTGTRSMDNEPVKLHSGAAQLALMTNKEIIPLRIDMNPPFLPKNVPVTKGAGSERAIYKIKKQETINPADFDTQNQIKARKAICSKIKEACFIHNQSLYVG